MRLLVNATIAKVNVFLRNKRDAESAVEVLEEIANDLCHRTQNPDPVYVAVAARFRLEIEECKVRYPLSGVNLTRISPSI